MVWRGNVQDHQKARKLLLEKYFSHPDFNIGHVNDFGDNAWRVKKMSPQEQLNYKFILSIEGNDVATNLKWIMGSHSLCFMCRPKYETWFMEGTLIPHHHYVLVKDDFSDLEEQFQYYKKHPEEAMRIIHNANTFVKQFKNKKSERKIALLVLDKYLNTKNTHNKV